ncbi:HAD family hydrolase [Kitasatospora sp. NPDC048239]|uniref:HAD family hydrolase n=1 Tax=Kitasatospora sp. NPDC048239 TaxID=3364046 RepID=UPI00371401F3
MLEFSGIALDVGGVIYYDEPFELAWLQGAFDRMSEDDPGVTLTDFLDQVERFYRKDGSGYSWGGSENRTALAAQAWADVRRRWGELAQEIPGAVAAVRDIAGRLPTVVVANQPPECAEVLDRWGVTAVCRDVLLDSLVGVAKPDPGLLDLGRTRLGLAPDRLLMVGNRVDHDVRPALALGCGAVFVRGDAGYRAPEGVHPDIHRVYRRLRAVRTAPPGPAEAVPIVSYLAELATRLGTEPPARRAPQPAERAPRAEPSESSVPGRDSGPGQP